MSKRKAIFLDRDGVLNDVIIKQGKPYPPASLADMTIAPDVLSTLLLWKSQDFLLIGATNQPDVARGQTTRDVVEAINNHLLQLLPLDEIRVCYHDDADRCDCRKPAPGLLLQAANEYDIDLTKSIMIGDRWKDIAAGKQAGCMTIWIDRGYQEQAAHEPDAIVHSLGEAATILRNTWT